MTPMTCSKSSTGVSNTGPPSPSTAGAGDGGVDIAQCALRLREGIDDGLLVAGIALDGERAAANLLDALGGCGGRAGSPVEHGDRRRRDRRG